MTLTRIVYIGGGYKSLNRSNSKDIAKRRNRDCSINICLMDFDVNESKKLAIVEGEGGSLDRFLTDER